MIEKIERNPDNNSDKLHPFFKDGGRLSAFKKEYKILKTSESKSREMIKIFLK